MAEKDLIRKTSGAASNYNFDESLEEIFGALDQIKRSLPNGELKVLQERIEGIEEVQKELKADLREIKKMLMDPDSGLIVKVNRSSELVKKNDEYLENVLKPKLDTITHLESWKENVTKVLWLLFAGIVSMLINTFIKN